jgi:hypothetical protein
MIVSMSRKLILARTICMMPRGTSYAKTNGSATSGRSCGAFDGGVVRSSGDDSAADLLRLLASATWALHGQCVRKQNSRGSDWEAKPCAPVCLHDSPYRRQPSLCNREHQKPDTGPNHCACGIWGPTRKPEIVTELEVEIHDHIAHIHGHPLIHIHIHAVIMSKNSCD